eukprot:PITA_16254
MNELCHLTHLLFVDYVMIFLDGSIRDSTSFHDILALFEKATGMVVNQFKSTITLSHTSPQEDKRTLHSFHYQLYNLSDGLKYLVFWIKPHSYQIVDWIWLVTKIEKRQKIWSHRFLSRAGCLVLIKSVLEATPVYWMSLTWIPRGILGRIQHICSRYLWNGQKEGKTFAWVSWKKIRFYQKNCWGGGEGVGVKRPIYFYTSPCSQDELDPPHFTEFMDHYVIPQIHLAATNIGLGSPTKLASFGHLYNMEINPTIFAFHQIWTGMAHKQCTVFSQKWRTSPEVGIPIQWKQSWETYLMALTEAHVHINDNLDELVWMLAEHGKYTPKLGYTHLLSKRKPKHSKEWCQ